MCSTSCRYSDAKYHIGNSAALNSTTVTLDVAQQPVGEHAQRHERRAWRSATSIEREGGEQDDAEADRAERLRGAPAVRAGADDSVDERQQARP